VLRWARAHDCPWDVFTCAYAADGGHLEVLQWAREHGCPWGSGTCLYAAVYGQMEVLQWVRENVATGQVWNEDDVRRFAGGPRKLEVLAWLDGLHAH